MQGLPNINDQNWRTCRNFTKTAAEAQKISKFNITTIMLNYFRAKKGGFEKIFIGTKPARPEFKTAALKPAP